MTTPDGDAMGGPTARLAPLLKAQLVGEQRELYEALVAKSVGRDESHVLDEAGAVRGPLAVLLRHPVTGRPLQQLATALRFGGSLPDAAREAAVLAVAAYWRDEHEWSRHEQIGREAGIAEADLAAIRAGASVSFDDPVTQAAYDAALAMVQREDLDDDEYARVNAVLGDERLVEVSVLVGYYALLAMQLRVFRVPASGS